MGSDRLPVNAHSSFAQRISMLRGALSDGTQAKLSRENGVAHHGQALIGAGASRPSRRKRRTRATAVSLRPSPVLPSQVGDAAAPAHTPKPIGHSPSRRPPSSFHHGAPRTPAQPPTTPLAAADRANG